MKRLASCLAAAAALVAGCAAAPDPWQASGVVAADARVGASSMIASFAATIEEDCTVGAPPMVEIVAQGALGSATVGSSSDTVEDDRDPCVGTAIPSTAIFYQATTPGFDVVTLRELGNAARPDVTHIASVRVR